MQTLSYFDLPGRNGAWRLAYELPKFASFFVALR